MTTDPKKEKLKLIENERTEWLRTLCGDGWRADIAEPWEIEWEGVRYIAATNGHAMTLLRADNDERAEPFKRGAEALTLFKDARWRSVPFADVERWALRTPERCGNCGGLGFLHDPDLAAFTSDGSGPVTNLWRPCGCGAVGTLAGVEINRRLLLRYLAVLTTGEVAIAAVKHTVALRSPDWLVLVMGLKNTPPTDPFEVPA